LSEDVSRKEYRVFTMLAGITNVCVLLLQLGFSAADNYYYYLFKEIRL